MQHNARIAAAIEVLDAVLAGEAAERCLTTWGRTHRFAGSGDRAAIRDLVFGALRRKRSLAWQGGELTGRGLIIGALLAEQTDVASVFNGEGHAPQALSEAEWQAARPLDAAPDPVRLDCPDWLFPLFSHAYPDEAEAILSCLQERAPLFLRANRSKCTRADAKGLLAEDGVETRPHILSETALEVTTNARRVRNTRAYREGFVELQDAASQAVTDRCLDGFEGGAVLDYCAGGGGKALALAATGADVFAYDANPKRMADIPVRAARAGTPIQVLKKVTGEYGLVMCDAPCSGSGAWRRQPDAKWTLDPERLTSLTVTQDTILDTAQYHVTSDGLLAYATCSLLPAENGDRADAFVARNPSWKEVFRRQWTPLEGGDGFFLALFRKS